MSDRRPRITRDRLLSVFELSDRDRTKVKVGFTARTVEQRRAEHEREHGRLCVIAQRPGSVWHERVLQARLESCRTSGEWFDPHLFLDPDEFWSETWRIWAAL